MTQLKPPLESFESPGGRRFTVGWGERTERWAGDLLWSERWLILFGDELAGYLFRSLAYGLGHTGKPRWHGSTRCIYWSHGADAPTGIGQDVGPEDTVESLLYQWACHADEILDWEAGKRIPSIYSKTGYFQREVP